MIRFKPFFESVKINGFHSTLIKNVRSIKKIGFRPSKSGVLGPGVYVAASEITGFETGKSISIPVEVSFKNPFIIKSKDRLQAIRDASNINKKEYDGIIWKDLVTGQFLELVAFNSKQVKIRNDSI